MHFSVDSDVVHWTGPSADMPAGRNACGMYNPYDVDPFDDAMSVQGVSQDHLIDAPTGTSSLYRNTSAVQPVKCVPNVIFKPV